MLPTQPKRKRTRKRKRRAAFSSSSSDSSSSESEDQQESKALPLPAAKPQSSSSDSDSESSSVDSSSDEETLHRRPREPVGNDKRKDSEKLPNRRLSLSPPPPPAELPSFLPHKAQDNTENTHMKEEEMKMKFRQFWMASVADGFRDDLEEIRKEPNLGKSRLALLIDSLASGSDVFSSSSNNSDVNEMEVILA